MTYVCFKINQNNSKIVIQNLYNHLILTPLFRTTYNCYTLNCKFSLRYIVFFYNEDEGRVNDYILAPLRAFTRTN